MAENGVIQWREERGTDLVWLSVRWRGFTEWICYPLRTPLAFELALGFLLEGYEADAMTLRLVSKAEPPLAWAVRQAAASPAE